MEGGGAGRAGFTLVEVLIAFILMTFIALVASLSISLFLDGWGKDRIGHRNDLRSFMNSVLLKDAVEGAYDYYVRVSRKGDQESLRVPYFRTWDRGFAFATSNPLWYEGETALGKLELQRDGDSFKLVYEESSLADKYLSFFDEEVVYERSVVIMEGIRSFSIRYFGARDITTAGIHVLDNDTVGGVLDSDVYDWYADYNGSERKMLPRKVKITLRFDPDDERVLVYPVHVFNREKYDIENPPAM